MLEFAVPLNLLFRLTKKYTPVIAVTRQIDIDEMDIVNRDGQILVMASSGKRVQLCVVHNPPLKVFRIGLLRKHPWE